MVSKSNKWLISSIVVTFVLLTAFSVSLLFSIQNSNDAKKRQEAFYGCPNPNNCPACNDPYNIYNLFCTSSKLGTNELSNPPHTLDLVFVSLISQTPNQQENILDIGSYGRTLEMTSISANYNTPENLLLPTLNIQFITSSNIQNSKKLIFKYSVQYSTYILRNGIMMGVGKNSIGNDIFPVITSNITMSKNVIYEGTISYNNTYLIFTTFEGQKFYLILVENSEITAFDLPNNQYLVWTSNPPQILEFSYKYMWMILNI